MEYNKFENTYNLYDEFYNDEFQTTLGEMENFRKLEFKKFVHKLLLYFVVLPAVLLFLFFILCSYLHKGLFVFAPPLSLSLFLLFAYIFMFGFFVNYRTRSFLYL